MPPRLTMMRSIATVALLTMPLTGCLSGLLSGSRQIMATVVECPELPPPTQSAVDALAAAGRSDPDTAAWLIDLDQHYDALDVCKAASNRK